MGSGMTEQIIDTSQGRFHFESLEIEHGTGKIDKDIAYRNLLDAKKLLDDKGIRFGLMFGTLLGAVRDGDFIDWDEDIDLYLLEEQREEFHNVLQLFRDSGLELIRADGDLYSIMRDGQYIDFYFFRLSGAKRKSLSYVVDREHLAADDYIEFRGAVFPVPSNKEALLEHLYGPDWRIPQRNKHAAYNTRYAKVAIWLRKTSPPLFSASQSLKRFFVKR
jgi:hypothetical protein